MDVVEQSHALSWNAFEAERAESASRGKSELECATKAIHPGYSQIIYPPPIFSDAFIDDVAHSTERLISIVQSIPTRVFDGDLRRWAAFLNMGRDETDTLLSIATPRTMGVATSFARPDVLITRNGFKAVELNISPYIAAGLSVRLAKLYEASPYFEFLRASGVAAHAADLAFHASRTFASMSRARPRTGRPVLLLAGAKTNSDFDSDFSMPDFEALMTSCGYEMVKGVMQDLRVRHDGVWHDGRRVDAVFTALTYSEMRSDGVSGSLIRSLVEADDQRQIDFICPPLNTFHDNKLTLEILTAPRFAEYFSADERRLLQRVLPRTQRLGTDVLDEVTAYRDRYVLKPVAEYGGAGVTIGAAVDQDEWVARLASALPERDRYIVQEVVDDLWTHESGAPGARQRYSVCFGPMIFGGRYAGSLLRQIPCTGRPGVISAANGAQLGVAFSPSDRASARQALAEPARLRIGTPVEC